MKLFETLVGVSSDYFRVGDVEFQAAPYSIMEYAEHLALPENDLGAKAAFLADKLARRVRGTKNHPGVITAEWVMENVPLPMLRVIEYILLYGEMPKGESEKKAP